MASTGARSAGSAITSGSAVSRPIRQPLSTSRSRSRYRAIRSTAVPGPDNCSSAAADSSDADRSIAAFASSALPEKWWYMLP